MSKKSTTILLKLQADKPLRKIVSIGGFNDGGFHMSVPYHSSQAGVIMKMPVNYLQDEYTFPWDSIPEHFSAANIVKLSYHASGQAHFSGKNIRSGYNPDGSHRGVGLQTSPTTTPITSGPSAAVVIWGFSDYAVYSGTMTRAMVFDLQDLPQKHADMNGLTLLIYTISSSRRSEISIENGVKVYYIQLENRWGKRALRKCQVIEIPDENIFLGVHAMRIKVNMGTSSGWNLSGPGQYDKSGRGHFLAACYPTPSHEFFNALPSADYIAEQVAP
ncbi:hypothetical protein [Massilia sp. Root418]|uniref:hypothetical protein n=1 Tax=Massilia sp. Root418 TaxID=1736532 RepID=UPI000AEFBBF5|nr:hypothetical protein [Massilia sp. Root418]